MNDTYKTQNNATEIAPSTSEGDAAIDPKETGTRGRPPGQPEPGVEKPGPGGTLSGATPHERSAGQ
ncbi:MAG: hypothetical protein JWQ10_654 [Herbaspirillum sp.]|nr:hypothetical protein [Herbaspirillum sp.]